jgi:hypothetical protein
MSFFELCTPDGESLFEPIFRTREGAEQYLADLREQVASSTSVPPLGAVMEAASTVLEYVAVREVTG